MLQSLSDLKPKSFRERVDKAVIRAVIGTKYKLGLGLTDVEEKNIGQDLLRCKHWLFLYRRASEAKWF